MSFCGQPQLCGCLKQCIIKMNCNVAILLVRDRGTGRRLHDGVWLAEHNEVMQPTTLNKRKRKI